MKRFAGIVMTAILLTVICVMPVSAANFELKDSNPEQGYEKVEVSNVMIKLFFSENVSEEATQTANEGKISMKDSSGKDVKFTVIYDSKDASKISLLVDGDLQEEEKYTVEVDGSLVSDTGSMLGENEELSFSTKKRDSGAGYLLLMFLMIIVMMVMTFRDQKKKMMEGDMDPLAGINTNPYKLAKEKNISVQEAVKLINEEKAKALKKAEKMNKKAGAQEEDEEEETAEEKVYRVKTKRVVQRTK